MNDIQKESIIPDQDCAVCLQKCQHPTQLPCGHIFCFLCVKGVAFQGRKCAMCRSAIPVDYLENPVLLEDTSSQQSNVVHIPDEYQWYYEGRNGWWKYDERSNTELEIAHSAGMPDCSLLLAGAIYVVDFQAMTQIRQSDHTRRRRVRRDTPLFPAKGVAGIKTEKRHMTSVKNENEQNSNTANENRNIEVATEEINVENISTEVIDDSIEHVLNGQENNIDNMIDRLSQIDIDVPDNTRGSLEDI